MEDKNNLVVYCEYDEGRVADVSLELLTKGRALASQLGIKLEALVIGDKLDGIENQLFPYGVDVVYKVQDGRLYPYTSLPHSQAVINLFKEIEPRICFMGATTIGRDLGPRVSSCLHSGLTADCTRLDVDVEKYQAYLRAATSLPEDRIARLDTADRNLKMTRPAFGGNVMATIICPNYRPQMATVRPGVMEMPQRDMNRQGKITPVDAGLSMDDRNVELLEVVHDHKKSVDITEAKVLVSGGRGVGSAEGYEPLRELAAVLGGEVASSRIGVDSGWIEKDRQVGQTGKTVHPDLYVACGISGAIQHLAGMEGSEFVIAINKDETCPMMKLADLGIVGDLHVIVPKLTEAIKAYKAAQKVD